MYFSTSFTLCIICILDIYYMWVLQLVSEPGCILVLDMRYYKYSFLPHMWVVIIVLDVIFIVLSLINLILFVWHSRSWLTDAEVMVDPEPIIQTLNRQVVVKVFNGLSLCNRCSNNITNSCIRWCNSWMDVSIRKGFHQKLQVVVSEISSAWILQNSMVGWILWRLRSG